jgi:hypothetical protein
MFTAAKRNAKIKIEIIAKETEKTMIHNLSLLTMGSGVQPC